MPPSIRISLTSSCRLLQVSPPASRSSSLSSLSAAWPWASPAAPSHVPPVSPHLSAAREACAALIASALPPSFRFRTYLRADLFTVELPPPFPGAPVMVLTHGYGSGSGLWALNLRALAATHHVYAVDWLGCGASERPPWPAGAVTVAAGEAFFTDSLEAWAAAGGLSRFVLVGHSLGGYLSAAYALAHPSRVSALVLVSPAGLPQGSPPVAPRGRALELLAGAWERGLTPQALVRGLGRFSRGAIERATAARFAHALRGPPAGAGASSGESGLARAPSADRPRLDHALLSAYLAGVTLAPPSGEAALRVLLAFGGAAGVLGMAPRLLGGPARAPPLRAPLTLLYGEHDWMCARTGARTAQALRAAGVDAACIVTPAAGHHLYLDNPESFAETMRQRLSGR